MKSLWKDDEAAQYPGELGQRVYTSRLLGRDPALVLHGGGNTSVKCREQTLWGEWEDILYVKGSGWDLATIEAPGFAPVRLAPLLKLADLPELSDPAMVNALKTYTTIATAPTPSVETILHALLPFKYVDHTHADAIIALTNTPQGEKFIQDLYGDRLVIVPYVMPGFALARVCREQFEAQSHSGTVGMVLMNHGLFTFGETAQESYERMIALVDEAERYAQQSIQVKVSAPSLPDFPPEVPRELAKLRQELSQLAGFPLILRHYTDEASRQFCLRPDAPVISQQGPATPDHVIRTKRLPMWGRDGSAYAQAYGDYFARNEAQCTDPKTMLDAAPRVILDPQWGLLTAGSSAKDAAIAGDIYHHTMQIIEKATDLGGYQALPEADIFAVEYWDLEQAKLKLGRRSAPFTGEVVLITGGASGIGRACVEAFLGQGAAVIALDIQPAITDLYHRPDYVGIVADVTDHQWVAQALAQGIDAFGGIDIVVLNAGIFPVAQAIADVPLDQWQKVMDINLQSNLSLLQQTYPFLKLAPKGGRVVAIGSKNVTAPGPGVAAYSASKAAFNQLLRVAALEWAGDNIRLNTIHPNGVFDTAIWTEEVLQARADHYGLTVEQYKTQNLLGIEITSQDVANLAVAMAGPLFTKITGAQVPLDGGNDRVI